MGQNIQILVKKQGWCYSDFYNLRQQFSKSWVLKSIRNVLEYYLNPVPNISSTEEKQCNSRNKNILNTVPNYWIA